MIGKRLGQYEIVERLGKGAMGEVYRARDTELERDVAIKVLPASLARDQERLVAFRQEARTLAGVQHPNIAAVYGLEHADGTQFFVQELVPGRSLGQRIRDGKVPDLTDLLSIAHQVAAALETAHAAGVVHRDLKPDNVMLTPDGTVKVLDFGLATPALDEDEAPQPGESSPTVSEFEPKGTILGTPSYMSPDQARGKVVDPQADIWAYGCLLYELIVGDRAFAGETLLDTLSAVVRGEPDWDAIPARTPPRLVALIRRCLRKKPRDRLQHIGDARIEIEEMQAEPSLAPGDPSPVADADAGWRLPVLAGLVVTAVIAAAAGAVAVRFLAPAAEPAPTLHASLALPENARLVVDTAVGVAISPDGTRVAYAARVDGVSRLHVQSLTSHELQVLPAPEDVNNPFFSPDGEWLGFFAQNRSLIKIPAGGGAAFEIAEVPTGNWGATWLPDDTIVFAPAFTGSGLMRVSASGGVPELLLPLDSDIGEVGHWRPQALPGGRRVLFTSRRSSGPVAVVLDLESGARRDVMPGVSDAIWSDTGHLLFSRNGTLFAIPFDPEAGETRGTPTRVADGLFIEPQSGEARFALSDSLVYVPGDAAPSADRLVWVDRDGNIEPLDAEPGDYGHPRLSPDGTALAVDRTGDSRGDIWVYDLERGGLTRLTRDGDNRMPIWKPDGLRIAFASNVGGATGVYWKNADGSGERHALLVADYSLWPRSWHDDAIAYYELNPDTGRDIWVLSDVAVDASDSEPRPRPLVRTSANERAPALSPDGRWIAYVSDESGRDEVYVQAFRGDPGRTTVSTDGGREPVWSRDGSEIFYRSGRRMMAVTIQGGDRLQAGTPELLFEGAFKADPVGSNQYFDVDLDGSRFLMVQEGDAALAEHLHIIGGFERHLRER